MAEKKFNIHHIATLARIRLDEEEKKRLEGHLIQILDYVDQLNQLDTSSIEPTSHILPIQNVFREDRIQKNFSETDLLGRAPRQDKGHYEVPQIIG